MQRLCLQEDFIFKSFLTAFEIIILLIFRDLDNFTKDLRGYSSMFCFGPLKK